MHIFGSTLEFYLGAGSHVDVVVILWRGLLGVAHEGDHARRRQPKNVSQH